MSSNPQVAPSAPPSAEDDGELPPELHGLDSILTAIERTGDTEALFAELDNAIEVLEGPKRHELVLRKAQTLARHGRRDDSKLLMQELLTTPGIGDPVIEALARAAYEDDEVEIHRHALEILASSSNSLTRSHALESLGDYHFEREGNASAAIESWKPAARLCLSDSKEPERGRDLYERVLDAAPDDVEASEHLVELYSRWNEWQKVPAVFAVLLRSEESIGRAVGLLLDLEGPAKAASAVDDYVAMIDETLPRLGSESQGLIHRLKRARARILTIDPTREEEASKAYRTLIESFAKEDDASAFRTFIESRGNAHERQDDRRWLFDWRASNSDDPVAALLEWADCEIEYGDTEAAIAVYERTDGECPDKPDVLSALARLKIAHGDVKGSARALQRLRMLSSAKGEIELDLRVATLLFEIGNAPEAVAIVSPLLEHSALTGKVIEIARSAVENDDAREHAVNMLENAAEHSDAPRAIAFLTILTESSKATTLPASRRASWFIDLAKNKAQRGDDPSELLLQAVAIGPDVESAWSSLKEHAGAANEPDMVTRAFDRATEGPLDAAQLEVITRDLLDFLDERFSGTTAVFDILSIALERAPTLRWALDRLKLHLSASAEWDRLFAFYDAAIEHAAEEARRAELLDEAALAARDLAGEPDRAIAYLERLLVLRPGEEPIRASLERLYERQQLREKLISLLTTRLDEAQGTEQRRLESRIASLWLDLENIEEAMVTLEHLMDQSGSIEDVVSHLERVVAQAVRIPRASTEERQPLSRPYERAISLLRAHYTASGETNSLIRVTQSALRCASTEAQRTKYVRDLVRLRLESMRDAPDAFARVSDEMSGDLTDSSLAQLAAECLLEEAQRWWTSKSEAHDGDAAQCAWWCTHILAEKYLKAGEPERAAVLLAEAATLPFERSRQRRLVILTAWISCDQMDRRDRALEILRDLFDEDPDDEIAREGIQRFESLLEQSGNQSELSRLLERIARHRARNDERTDAKAYFERAAALWEEQRDSRRALAAYRHGAALGSLPALEALARIYTAKSKWRKAVDALEWLFASTDGSRKVECGIALADGYQRLGEPELSRARLASAIAVAPDAWPARDRLAQLYREAELWEPLADLLVAGAALSNEADEADRTVALLKEAASIHVSRRGAPEAALPLLETAATTAPDDRELQFALIDALVLSNRHADAVPVLHRVLHASEGESREYRARLHHQLAAALSQVEEGGLALEELRAAARLCPQSEATLRKLADFAFEHGDLALAESTYRSLLLLLHHSVAPGPDATSRADVYLALSDIARLHGDVVRSGDLVESAFEASLDDPHEAERLEQTLRAHERPDLLARALERRLHGADLSEATAKTLAELIDLRSLSSEQNAEQEAALRSHAERLRLRATDTGITDPSVWRLLEAAHGALAGDEARIETSRRRIETLLRVAPDASDPNARAALIEGAQLCTGELDDRETARTLAGRIFEACPLDESAWSTYCALRGTTEDSASFIRSVSERARSLDAPSENTLLWRLADFLDKRGEKDDAITEVLDLLLHRDPADLTARDRLSEYLERSGDDERVVATLKTVVEGSTHGDDLQMPPRLALRLGRALERLDRPAEAIRAYEAVLDFEKVESETLQELTERLERLDAPRFADSLERWIQISDSRPASHLVTRLAQLRETAGDDEGVLRALALGFSADPKDDATFDKLLAKYKEHERWDDVEATLARAVAARPDEGRLLDELVETCRRNGKLDRALRALNEALKSRPNGVRLLRSRARLHEERGELDQAVLDIERARVEDPSLTNEWIELLERAANRAPDPSKDPYRMSLVAALIDTNRFDEARARLDAFLDEHPSHVVALRKRGDLAMAEDDWDCARTTCLTLLDLLDEEQTEARVGVSLVLGDACSRAGLLDDAALALESAHEADPDNGLVHERLERLYEATDKFVPHADLLIARSENDTDPGIHADVVLRAARLYERGGLPDRMLDVLDSIAWDGRPEEVDAALLVARAKQALGARDEALASLVSLAKSRRSKGSAVLCKIHLELANLHLAADEIFEAYDALQQAFTLNPSNEEASLLLGLVAIDLDDERTATRALRAVTTRRCKLPAASKALAFFQLARIARLGGDDRRATMMVKNALLEDPAHEQAAGLLKELRERRRHRARLPDVS